MIILMYIFIQVEEPDTIWTEVYENEGTDTISTIIEVEDNNYLIGGKNKTGMVSNSRRLKINRDGGVIWDIFDSKSILFRSFIFTKEGDYVFTGDYSGDISLVRVNRDGDSIWNKTYGHRPTYVFYGYDVEQTEDSGFIVVGYRDTYDGNYYYEDVYVVRTDKDGDSLWARAYGSIEGDSMERGRRMIRVDDGYIICGYKERGAFGDKDGYLLKIDDAGDSLWAKVYGYEGRMEEFNDIERVGDGFVVVGYVWRGYYEDDYEMSLMRFDSNGDSLWSRYYGGDGDDRGYGVAVTPDRGFIIVGYTGSYGAGGKDVYIVRVDSVGEVEWEKVIGGVGDETGIDVIVDSDSNYVVAGYSNSFSADNDVYIIKIGKDVSGVGEDDRRNINSLTITEQNLDYIEFEIGITGYADISLYDIQGRKVDDIYSGYVNGNKRITYDWKDLSKGVYFIRAEIGDKSITEKVIKIR